ncbi:MAG: M48 family metallopeptidase [Rhodocyclaceae bacterium]|nr:M48 family metallopeptidase [Rhodocyclaceae bacterium]
MDGQLELFRLPPPAGGAYCPAHLLLNGRLVSYRLRRDRRRLSMRIDETGLTVGAPRGLPLAEIERFILAHGAWVLAKLDEFAARPTRRHLPIHDGATLPVLGRPASVRVIAGANRGYWKMATAGEELWLAARPGADLARLARRALQRRALDHFAPRLADMTRRLDLSPPPLALSSARTRWGSCSATRGIRLNWRLIHLPVELIDYVIAHEAAHLLEMNHGPRFWALVEHLYPNWRQARETLKRAGSALPLV